MDRLKAFIEDKCQWNPSLRVKTTDLYGGYIEYIRGIGDLLDDQKFWMSPCMFTRRFKKIYPAIRTEKARMGNYFVGIGITNATPDISVVLPKSRTDLYQELKVRLSLSDHEINMVKYHNMAKWDSNTHNGEIKWDHISSSVRTSLRLHQPSKKELPRPPSSTVPSEDDSLDLSNMSSEEKEVEEEDSPDLSDQLVSSDTEDTDDVKEDASSDINYELTEIPGYTPPPHMSPRPTQTEINKYKGWVAKWSVYLTQLDNYSPDDPRRKVLSRYRDIVGALTRR